MRDSPLLPDLTGRHLGVTHSGDGAEWLVTAFRRLNAAVHHVPLIDFVWLDGQERLAHLEGVQWLVLTSPQGVQALARALEGRAAAPGVKWAAVGQSTAQAMRQQGLPVHFTPSRATGAVLGQELPLGGAGTVGAGTVGVGTVLHVTSDQARDDLPRALRRRGGQYERLVLYRTVPRLPTPQQAAQLLASDAVTLASGSAAQQFARLGGQAVPVAVMGTQTAQAALALGFRQVRVAPDPSLEGLKQAALSVLDRPDC